MSLIKKLLLTVLLALGCAASATADDNVVGMVLDLQGAVQLLDKGGSARLQLLAKLTPGSRIELPAGARASLSLYANRSVYRLTGPGQVEINGDGLKVVHGAAPDVKAMGEKQVLAAQSASLIPGAYRMRALRLASQQDLTELRALRPAETDPIEDWVFHAVLLQQRQLHAEAREAWQHIARQRPDLERASELAR